MDWQPIATAPKDGTVILGINDEWFSNGAPIRCRFARGEWQAEHMGLTLNNPRFIADPTHWMPTPPEPKD